MSAGARKLVAAASVGAAVGLFAAVLAWLRPPALERGEFWSYDARARHGAHPAQASGDIVVVDISDADLRDVQRNLRQSWPWPRALHGYLVDYLTRDGARAVAFDFIFNDLGRTMNDNEEFAQVMRDSGRAVIGLSTPRPAPDATTDEPPPLAGELAAGLRTFPTRAEALAHALASYLEKDDVRSEALARASSGRLGVKVLEPDSDAA